PACDPALLKLPFRHYRIYFWGTPNLFRHLAGIYLAHKFRFPTKGRLYPQGGVVLPEKRAVNRADTRRARSLNPGLRGEAELFRNFFYASNEASSDRCRQANDASNFLTG